MTAGERIYLLIVLLTFAVFTISVGQVSLRQTRADREKARNGGH